jgi:hypothetical protein
MDTGFPLPRTLCFEQVARLMSKEASLSVALRGCVHNRGARASVVKNPPRTHTSAEGSFGPAVLVPDRPQPIT